MFPQLLCQEKYALERRCDDIIPIQTLLSRRRRDERAVDGAVDPAALEYGALQLFPKIR